MPIFFTLDLHSNFYTVTRATPMRMMGPPSQELNNFVVNRFLTIRAFVAGRAAEAPLSLGSFHDGLRRQGSRSRRSCRPWSCRWCCVGAGLQSSPSASSVLGVCCSRGSPASREAGSCPPPPSRTSSSPHPTRF